ncbi:MAG TPA: preprotein translocase subunit SecY [Lacipirellulaceae bacterium]|nr:preprotein translocase subunit SecY [Lacipirellulaceae bacterium]
MWEKVKLMWKIPELRTKIGLTLLMLAIYRVGFQIQVPILDQAKVNALANQHGGVGDMLETVAMLSASQLKYVTIFGLGIMPYISAAIIFELLASVYAPLEELQKEGEAGRKKINEYTRYTTFFLCMFQSWFYITSYVQGHDLIAAGFDTWYWKITTVLTMTAGSMFLMWLGEQIDEFGIGNGISLLIMAGILARMPGAGYDLLQQTSLDLSGTGGKLGIAGLIVLAAMFVAVVTGIVFIELGQRRISTQSAKHVRGRRVFGGTRNYLPLKVNQGGVMPIIFASSLLMFPMIIFANLDNPNIASPDSWFGHTMHWFSEVFGRSERGYIYNISYLVLIYFFCYFWTAITFNPKDMADNLKNFGSFIPGYRPGKRTADYLEKVMVRITYVGAGYLAVVAIIPTIISTSLGVNYMIASFYGGTSLLIAVEVGFDLVQKIDSHLVMRNYSGLLQK